MDAPSTGPRLHQLLLPRLGTHQPTDRRAWSLASGLWRQGLGGLTTVLEFWAWLPSQAQKMDLWFEGWAERPVVD